uniref:Orf3 n=1 Tax=Rattus sp. TaxID=10118 RepID=Q80XV5_9MURI|nr:orf3 [Rattus sp.]
MPSGRQDSPVEDRIPPGRQNAPQAALGQRETLGTKLSLVHSGFCWVVGGAQERLSLLVLLHDHPPGKVPS